MLPIILPINGNIPPLTKPGRLNLRIFCDSSLLNVFMAAGSWLPMGFTPARTTALRFLEPITAPPPERAASLPADDWRKGDANFNEPRLSANLELVEQLGKIAARKGQTVGNLAIAWTLHHPAVTGAIVGARRPQQIEETVHAAELSVPAIATFSDDTLVEGAARR